MEAEPGADEPPSPAVHGREREVAALRDAVAGARAGRGAAVLVVGEPGMGRTTLLAAAAGAAGDFTVCRMAGAVQEADVVPAGLNRLLLPLARWLDSLPTAQARLLAEVLAGRLPEGGELGVAMALLRLWEAAARTRPLAVCVDDAQFLDAVSLRVLGCAARRLAGLPVLVVLAADTGSRAAAALEGARRIDLPQLAPSAAARLLRERSAVPPDPATEAELLHLAEGNPLALVELAAAVDPGRAATPVLPAGSRLRAHHRRRVQALSEAARTVVWLALVGERLPVRTLAAAAHGHGSGGAGPSGAHRALDEALRSGLVTAVESDVGEPEVTVPGRLLRTGLLAAMPLAARQAAHAALAEVLDGASVRLLRAVHRLAAAEVPSDALVRQLDEAARTARADGDPAASAGVLERAAEVATHPDTRARWLVTAAADRLAAGEPEQSRALLRRVLPRCRTADTRGLRMLVRGEIELRDGVPASAYRSLSSAAGLFSPEERCLRARALVLAGEASCLAGDFSGYFALAARAELARRSDDPAAVRLVHDHFAGMAATFRGHHATARQSLRGVIRTARALCDPESLVLASQAAYTLGEAGRAHALAVAAVHGARESGRALLVPGALVYQSLSALLLDRYAAAEAAALEGLRLAETTGQRNVAVDHMAVLGLLAALQGDRASAALRLGAAAHEVAARELGRPQAFNCWVSACIDLVEDRPADALHRFRHMTAGTGQFNPAVRALATPHYVEAASRCGQHARALGALHAFESWAAGSGSTTRLALAQRCHGLLAEDDTVAEEHFRESLRLHQHAHTALELAKTELFFAHRLRRARKPGAARSLLREALTIFRQFDARPWADRATAELRAAGETVGPAAPRGKAELTAQQMRISALVAEGATNREIADRLVLSTRTVDYHLRNIFARLGVRSRVELAALFR